VYAHARLAVFDDAPVAVAANRDEALEREALPPAVYSEGAADRRAERRRTGGTWIGYNEYGVFVGITNKWTDADLAGERSRDCSSPTYSRHALPRMRNRSSKRRPTPTSTTASTSSWPTRRTRSVTSGTARSLLTEFEPGFTSSSTSPSTTRSTSRRSGPMRVEQAANAKSVREALAPESGESAAAWLERAGDVLGDHEFGVCIHRNGYGTRSSSLIALGPETARYAFAPGPPCRTSYDDVSVRTGDGATDPEHGATRPTRTLHSKGKGTFKRLAPSRMDMDALLPVATHTARWSP